LQQPRPQPQPQQQQQHGAAAAAAADSWVPTPEEKIAFDRLFDQADVQRTGKLWGRAAVQFFSRSALPKDVLRSVWEIADAAKQSVLGRPEFYVAMRLIAMAQHGVPPPLSHEALVRNRFAHFALPNLSGSGAGVKPTAVRPAAAVAAASAATRALSASSEPAAAVAAADAAAARASLHLLCITTVVRRKKCIIIIAREFCKFYDRKHDKT
jgi:hypothetical protein